MPSFFSRATPLTNFQPPKTAAPAQWSAPLGGLLDVARGALFSGDLLVTKEGKLSGPPIIMEKAQMKESIAKIAMLTFTVMLPGHGDPIKENASAMVKAFSL